MRKTTALGIAALSLLVACGEMKPHTNGVRLQVHRDVNVSSDGAGGCTIQPIPYIQVTNKNNADIVWTIAQPGTYQFDTAGIKFVSGKPDPLPPGDELSRTNSGPTAWTYHDRNTKAGAGTFGYEVHVKVKASGKTCKLDPTVYNDGTCDPNAGPC